MTAKLQERGVNLNTFVLIGAIIGAVYGGIKIAGPIINMPERSDKTDRKIEVVSEEMGKIKDVQVAQAESLKILTGLAATSNDLRREVDRLSFEQSELRRRLEKAESVR
jgi:hypothetical protein